jgi:DNA-binding NarL/FixJ family response regulator
MKSDGRMNARDFFHLLLADATTPTEWAACGIAVAATAFVLFRPRMKAKKDPLARSPDANSLSQQRSVERQMQNLLVELSEMARQVTAGLDTRAARLDALIQEADQKIAMLSALQSAVNGSASAHASAESAVPAAATIAPFGAPSPAPCAYEPDPRHVEVYTLADEGQSSSQIASKLNRPNGEIELILALRPRN